MNACARANELRGDRGIRASTRQPYARLRAHRDRSRHAAPRSRQPAQGVRMTRSVTASASRTPRRCTRCKARSLATEIPAAGYAAPGRGLRNPRSLITGSGAGLAISCSGGAAVARLAHNQEVVGSIPTPATSSGDGLGIQQPGSMTWGGFFVPTAPSGRADESAMCPAVARSFEGRAA